MSDTKKNSIKNIVKLIIFVIIIGTLIIVMKLTPIGTYLSNKIQTMDVFIKELGFWGYVVYLFIYIIGVIIAVPGAILTILAGGLFGTVKGTILVSIGSTIGASLSFLIARYFARDAISNWIKRSEHFNRLDRMTEEYEAIIVAIARLVPFFPFNILNFGFGLTRVKFWKYVFWSWLCMLPGTVLYVAGTDAIKKTIQEKKIPWVIIVIFVISLIIVTLLVYQAKKSLKEKETKEKNDG